MFGYEADEFADPKDEGGAAYDDEPVGEVEGFHVKEFASDGDDEYLAKKDQDSDDEKPSASLEVEGGLVGGEGAGIKEVPKLEEDEDCEEEREFIILQTAHIVDRGTEKRGQRCDIVRLEIIK